MKTKTKVLLLSGLTACLIFFSSISCKKQIEPQEKVNLKEQILSTLATAPYDTVSLAEADTMYHAILNNGGLDQFDTAYDAIRPDFELSVLFTAIDVYPGIPDRVALYVPMAQSWHTGKRLTMIVMKEHGFLRVVLMEDVPNTAWLSSSENYAGLSGVKRFYKYTGDLIKAINFSYGVPGTEIPPEALTSGPGSLLLNGPTEPNPADWIGGPDDDDDLDGVANEDDYCPNTAAAVFVDNKGCPLNIGLDEVVVTSFEDVMTVIPTFDWMYTESQYDNYPPDTWGYPTDNMPYPSGNGVEGVGMANRGRLCGFYTFDATGSAKTAHIKNTGARWSNITPAINMEIPDMCVTIPYVSSAQASRIFKAAFNYAISRVTYDMNTGVIYLPSAINCAAAFQTHFINELKLLSGPGAAVSYGPCLGGISISYASYEAANGECI